MPEQTVVCHSSVRAECDGGQEHVWQAVRHRIIGTIRLTTEKCRSCDDESVLRDDGGRIILRMAPEAVA